MPDQTWQSKKTDNWTFRWKRKMDIVGWKTFGIDKISGWKLDSICGNDFIWRGFYCVLQTSFAWILGLENAITQPGNLEQDQPGELFRKTSFNPTVDHDRAAKRLELNLKRHHNRKIPPMALNDRPSRPSKQVYQKPWQIIPPLRHRRSKAKRRHKAHENSLTGHPNRQMVPSIKHRHWTGPGSITNSKPADSQDLRFFKYRIWWQDLNIQWPFQVVHDHDLAQPALQSWDIC